jgi:hypothetical protein
MKSIIATALLFALLSVSGFAYAATDLSDQSGRVHCCSNPHYVFAGPKVGWVEVPSE